MSSQLVNIIFGMKVKQARTDLGINVSEFAAQCDLSPSYVTEIEKGRKYPRADKIIRMAEVLGKSYDDLVSIRLEPPLTHLGTALSSPILGQFPFDEFGIEMSDLINVLTREPDKASALLHAISEVGRQYDMKEQHFLRAALRSYQELHDNYFQDLEDSAAEFAKEFDLLKEIPVSRESLERIITRSFGLKLDFNRIAPDTSLTVYRSILVKGNPSTLVLNSQLHPSQLKFVLARELGYQYLGLTDRAITSSPDQVDSFQQVFNDFKASYFAGALLMPRPVMLDDIQAFFDLPTWTPAPLFDMLEKYDVSSESLLYRFTELVPQFFGMRLHYLRLHNAQDKRYRLIKELNMNRLRVPNRLADEHFCRHWLVVRLLHDLRLQQQKGAGANFAHPAAHKAPYVGIQMSEYLDANDHFLCFGFARPLSLQPHVNTCSIIGFRDDADLSRTIRFAKDPQIPHVIINETCERCPLTLEQCSLRAAPPTILESQQAQAKRRQALRQLIAQMR